ncbi:uncharacterized protein LOC127724575 [Mytilus californianus]|uniref:uncharacterized protein LOC127724575 n=1 Tax=Mytilus californianus TaxID=6549 RepID=UPI002247253A|nr:uncharacterized protein LOC127724575 [Mytilus californianus]
MNTNNDGEASGSIEKKEKSHERKLEKCMSDTDYEGREESTDHFCKTVQNNGGSKAQEDSPLRSSAVNIHLDESIPIAQPGTDVKILSSQPSDLIDLDTDLPNYNLSPFYKICKSFPHDSLENVEREYKTVTVTRDARYSHEHEEEVLKTSGVESISQDLCITQQETSEVESISQDLCKTEQETSEVESISQDLCKTGQKTLEVESISQDLCKTEQETSEVESISQDLCKTEQETSEVESISQDLCKTEQETSEVESISQDLCKTEQETSEVESISQDLCKTEQETSEVESISQDLCKTELETSGVDNRNKDYLVGKELQITSGDISCKNASCSEEEGRDVTDITEAVSQIKTSNKLLSDNKSNQQLVVTHAEKSLKRNRNHYNQQLKTEMNYIMLSEHSTMNYYILKRTIVIEEVIYSNEYYSTNYCRYEWHEVLMNASCRQNFRPDHFSLESQVKEFFSYNSWYYDHLTGEIKYAVHEFFVRDSTYAFQYSFTNKMHENKYQKETYKFLFEQFYYQFDIIANPVIRVEPEYLIPPVDINDVHSRGLVTIYYESEEEDHDHNELTSHAQAAHVQGAHAQAAYTQAAYAQSSHAQNAHVQGAHAQDAHADILNMTPRRVHPITEDNMTAETTLSPAITLSPTDRGIQCNGSRETYALNTGIVQSTENTMNIIAKGVMVQRTASTTSMNTSTTGSQYSSTRGTYRMAAETSQLTVNATSMNTSATGSQYSSTRGTYRMAAETSQVTANATSINTSATGSQYSSTRGTYRMAAETSQVTASTTSMNTSTTGSQYSSTRGTYRIAAETSQVTANATSMNTSATGSQYSSTRGTYRMAAETSQVTANATSMNISATGSQYSSTRRTYRMAAETSQVTANATSMNTSTTVHSSSRGTYRMVDETVQRTANMMNVSARTEQRVQEAYSMTAASGHGTNLRTSGLSTHIISSNSSADARSDNNTLATMPHIQETRNSRQGRGNQASRVIESDPVRIEDQPLGANHLADLIQEHIHQNGSQLQRTPLAGQDRPDMCSPDTVTTVLTSAVLQNRFILDYFRTMGATGAQVHVLEIVRNYLQHNYGSVTADIRQMVLEKHGDVGDIHSEAHVISAIIGDTKTEIMTTCSNQECPVINSRMIESSLIIKYQGTLTSTSVGHYLNQHLMGKEEPCSNCQRIPPGIKRTVRSIESTFIYINASQGRVPKANVKDMLSQFCVGESHYQIHALSFWHDQHFTVRINIHNMWWTYDNKRGIFNQGVEVDDCMPGILSGIYIKKIA